VSLRNAVRARQWCAKGCRDAVQARLFSPLFSSFASSSVLLNHSESIEMVTKTRSSTIKSDIVDGMRTLAMTLRMQNKIPAQKAAKKGVLKKKATNRRWTNSDKVISFRPFIVTIKGKKKQVVGTVLKQSSLGPAAGGGIFPASRRWYRKGTVFGEYGGEIITKEEARRRRLSVTMSIIAHSLSLS
jgi:hypothetical protein